MAIPKGKTLAMLHRKAEETMQTTPPPPSSQSYPPQPAPTPQPPIQYSQPSHQMPSAVHHAQPTAQQQQHLPPQYAQQSTHPASTHAPTTHASYSAATSTTAAPIQVPHTTKGRRLLALLKDIDKHFELDEEAEAFILDMADDFVERVTRPAIELAKHRKATALEPQDLQIVLQKQWDIRIPLASSEPDASKAFTPQYQRLPAGQNLIVPGARKRATPRATNSKAPSQHPGPAPSTSSPKKMRVAGPS